MWLLFFTNKKSPEGDVCLWSHDRKHVKWRVCPILLSDRLLLAHSVVKLQSIPKVKQNAHSHWSLSKIKCSSGPQSCGWICFSPSAAGNWIGFVRWADTVTASMSIDPLAIGWTRADIAVKWTVKKKKARKK